MRNNTGVNIWYGNITDFKFDLNHSEIIRAPFPEFKQYRDLTKQDDGEKISCGERAVPREYTHVPVQYRKHNM